MLSAAARGKVWTAELPSVDGRAIVPRVLLAGTRPGGLRRGNQTPLMRRSRVRLLHGQAAGSRLPLARSPRLPNDSRCLTFRRRYRT